jgi:hypothetical protein
MSRYRRPASDNEVEVRETYRGHEICARRDEIIIARQKVDRVWSRKIYEADGAAGRAAVYAEEKELVRKMEQKASGRK